MKETDGFGYDSVIGKSDDSYINLHFVEICNISEFRSGDSLNLIQLNSCNTFFTKNVLSKTTSTSFEKLTAVS